MGLHTFIYIYMFFKKTAKAGLNFEVLEDWKLGDPIAVALSDRLIVCLHCILNNSIHGVCGFPVVWKSIIEKALTENS